MKIQEIEFSRLIPADYNPRVALTPDMPEFERLKNSIETFGNVEPIVWNERTGHIEAATSASPCCSTSATPAQRSAW